MAQLIIGTDKLQHIYDLHAADFALVGSKSPQQLRKLRDALALHVSNAATTMVEGKYRGRDANLHLNLETGNVVVTDRDLNIIAAFKASPAQAQYIRSTGRLN